MKRKSIRLFGGIMAAAMMVSLVPAMPAVQAEQVEMIADAEAQLLEKDYQKSIFVKKVDNLSSDFIRGVDISSYVSIIDSGATFKDYDGNVLDDAGFFKLLKESGVNYVRIRIWNDPYTADGKGYGGGNNDLAKAKKIGKLAADAGIKTLIDFHYSDFWADPSRQYAPKAWKDMTVAQKEEALYEYTKNSLKELLDAGVDVGMVQVGNETNHGMAGVDCSESWEDVCKLYSAGSKAIREVSKTSGKEIQVAVHFTDANTKGEFDKVSKELDTYKVDYDVFAASYYPNTQGTMENITSVLQSVAKTYGKKVMVAETAWAWTSADGDGHGQGFDAGSDADYAVSVQGQANAVRDVIEAVNNIEDNAGIGVFYWEPAWIPVTYAYDKEGNYLESVHESNKKKWEEFGSGWASSYSDEYDHEHGGLYYGGSVKDNEAFFDFEGNPLPSLSIFKDVYTGKTGAVDRLEVVKAANVEVKLESADVSSEMDTIKKALPKTVTGVYSSSKKEELSVVWNEEDLKKLSDFGAYTIGGKASYKDGETENGTKDVSCAVTILPKTILVNGDFEEQEKGWTVSNSAQVNNWTETPLRGEGSAHFWSADAIDFTLSQTADVAEDGNYCASFQLQGGDGAETDEISITVTNKTTGASEKANAALQGWNNWQNPRTKTIPAKKGDVLEVVITVKSKPGAWGSIDDVFLYRIVDKEVQIPAKKGTVITAANGAVYKVTKSSATNGTVSLTGVTKKTSGKITIPAAIKADGISYKVTAIAENAFKKNEKVTAVTVGTNVKTIGKNAFSGAKKVKTLTVKSDKLTKSSVKNALKGSSVTTVKLSGDAAKKQYTSYKKIFAKSNSGKTVKIKK